MNYYASPPSCLVIIEVKGNWPKDKFNPTSSFYGVKQVKARNITWFARSHISSEGLCWVLIHTIPCLDIMLGWIRTSCHFYSSQCLYIGNFVFNLICLKDQYCIHFYFNNSKKNLSLLSKPSQHMVVWLSVKVKNTGSEPQAPGFTSLVFLRWSFLICKIGNILRVPLLRLFWSVSETILWRA